MSRFSGFNSGPGNNTVTLNVYDLADNQFLYPMGLGLYHSGVQVGRKEYTFSGGSGIFSMDPKGVDNFRESIVLGQFDGSSSKIDSIIRDLQAQFQPNDYHLLNKNCNSFAEVFVWRLLQVSIPGFVNRMANVGSMFSCLLPESMTGQAPVEEGGNSQGGMITSGGGGSYGSARSNSSRNTAATQAFSGTGFRCETASAGGSGSGGSELSRRELARQAALNRM